MALTQKSRSKRRSPYGPNIVRAWFDTVFQPLLRGLEMERGVLARKNWTWEFWRPSLRSLAPVREHVSAEAWDNLEQLLSFHPELTPPIDEHDRRVQELFESCQAFHYALVSSPELRNLWKQIAEECPRTVGGEPRNHFGAYSTDEEFIAVLADYVVNNVSQQPAHYATSKLWNHYRERLTALRELPGIRPYEERTTSAGEKLAQAVEALLAVLRKTRSDLSIAYDLPFVAETAVLR